MRTICRTAQIFANPHLVWKLWQLLPVTPAVVWGDDLHRILVGEGVIAAADGNANGGDAPERFQFFSLI